MDLKSFALVFVSVFLAEIGDKTQIATMVFATDKAVSKYVVFAAASTALVLAAGIGVLAGSYISNYFGQKLLNNIAGIAFILIGALLVWRGL
ncbi:MAG: TMEM165/GDT1 family protein [Arenicellales bacterium]